MENYINKMADKIINYNLLDKLIYFTFSVLILTALIVFISAVSIKITLGICIVLYGILQILELNN